MAEFFAEYGLFLLKTVTIVIGIIAVIAVAAAAGRKASHEGLEESRRCLAQGGFH